MKSNEVRSILLRPHLAFWFLFSCLLTYIPFSVYWLHHSSSFPLSLFTLSPLVMFFSSLDRNCLSFTSTYNFSRVIKRFLSCVWFLSFSFLTRCSQSVLLSLAFRCSDIDSRFTHSRISIDLPSLAHILFPSTSSYASFFTSLSLSSIHLPLKRERKRLASNCCFFDLFVYIYPISTNSFVCFFHSITFVHTLKLSTNLNLVYLFSTNPIPSFCKVIFPVKSKRLFY